MAEGLVNFVSEDAMNARNAAPLLVTIYLAISGCSPVPPAQVAPRTGTPVSASQSKTWEVVIELFSERNLPIKNMDRASGFIATDPLGVPLEEQPGVDCGKSVIHVPNPPRTATYSVFVRGDSTSSTVKAAVRWTSQSNDELKVLIECTTTGDWESAFERDVKTRVEGT
ncbi:MAG TPA: hypothetical protein VGO46_12010 [Gemmatimonadaceae bacterium]|jgi:hypothetical protein|nr:hypothetical protein [Gemmatimonadaceae bacterium]